MTRTIGALVLLLCAILWLPVPAQLALFAISVAIVPRRLLLYIPAILSDVLYAPSSDLSPRNLKMTIIVSILLLIYWVIITKTRVKNVYAIR